MTKVFLHPFAGGLSAYGMGLADVRALRERQVELPFGPDAVAEMEAAYAELMAEAEREVRDQGVQPGRITRVKKAQLRYEGTDSPLPIDYAGLAAMPEAFDAAHQQRFGFVAVERRLVVAALPAEAIAPPHAAPAPPPPA